MHWCEKSPLSWNVGIYFDLYMIHTQITYENEKGLRGTLITASPFNKCKFIQIYIHTLFFSVLRLEYAQIHALLSSLNVFINPDSIDDKENIRYRNLSSLFTFQFQHYEFIWKMHENFEKIRCIPLEISSDAHMITRLWLSGVQCHCFWLRESSLSMKNILISFFFEFYSQSIYLKNAINQLEFWNEMSSIPIMETHVLIYW